MGAAVFVSAERPQWALTLTGIEQRFGLPRRTELGSLLLEAAHDVGSAIRAIGLANLSEREPEASVLGAVRLPSAGGPAGDGRAMASVRVEIGVRLPASVVWEAIADVGAVHRRLLPGRVVDARLKGDTRILTMSDGSVVRELILAVDHETRRMAYAVVSGQGTPLAFHHASFQVFDEGGDSRLVWITDVLPHAAAQAVCPRVQRAIEEMKRVLEGRTPLG